MRRLVHDAQVALALYTTDGIDAPAGFKSQVAILNIGIVRVGGESKQVIRHAWGRKGRVDFIAARLRNWGILGKALEPQPAGIRGVFVQHWFVPVQVYVSLLSFRPHGRQR